MSAALYFSRAADSAPRVGTPHEVRDSAGVSILVMASLESASYSVRIAQDAFIDLGRASDDPRAEFDPRQNWLSAIELAGGAIVVNDFNQLKFFDRAGRLLGVAGRSGQGPGEFSHVREICRLHGDTVLAIDYGDGRTSLWTIQGNLVETFPRAGFIPFNGCFEDGTVLLQRTRSVRVDASGERSYEYVRARLDGTPVLSVGRLPGPVYHGPVLREESLVPFGESIVIGAGATYEFRIESLSGESRRITRVLEPPRRVTSDEWDRLIESMVPSNATAAQRSAMLARFRTLRPPLNYPAYRRVRVDPVGRIWVGDYHDSAEWAVFDSTGALLGRARLPVLTRGTPVNLVGLGRDHVILKWFDEDGASRLSFHRFTIATRR
ncbi:MAG: hypothetical protein ACT4P7_11670 [Gemmatimonadaceae bacterium]